MTFLSASIRPAAWGLLVATIFAVTGPVFAQQVAPGPPNAPAAPSAPIVRSIDVEYTGPATVSKERILAQMRTGIGSAYSDAVVEQDIRNLYSTGVVRNVRIFAQPLSDGVKVIVAIQTRMIVREIEVDGAVKIQPKRVRKILGQNQHAG